MNLKKQTISEYLQTTDNNKLKISKHFREVKYKRSRIPGVERQKDLWLGANCQVYAYEFLKEFNRIIPNFRSKELWEDHIYTKKIEKDFLEFDIMLYNIKNESFGAHIGLYLGENKVLHLSKDNKTPMIESHESLLSQEKYRYFIGAKRVIKF